MNIKRTFTGNKYILGSEEELKHICDTIQKSRSAIHFSERYNCYVMCIKSKNHKARLKELLNDNISTIFS